MMGRWVCAGALLALCAFTGLLVWQQSHIALAQRSFDRWVRQPSEVTALHTTRFLKVAQILPDPAALWLAGRWKIALDPADDRALEDFAAVAAARPLDYRPALAAAKWWADNDPASAEFGRSMGEAMTRGPNESKVFAALFPLARFHWHYLSPDMRELQERALVNTAVREPALAIELARDYGYAGPACRLTETNALAQGHCRRLGIIDTDKENP